MASVKRFSQPRLDQLIYRCEEESNKLSDILKTDVGPISENSTALIQLIANVKRLRKELSSLCSDCVCALYKHGSVKEAEEIKELKDEKKLECKEFIALILHQLDVIGVSDNISNVTLETNSQCSDRDSVITIANIFDTDSSHNVELAVEDATEPTIPPSNPAYDTIFSPTLPSFANSNVSISVPLSTTNAFTSIFDTTSRADYISSINSISSTISSSSPISSRR